MSAAIFMLALVWTPAAVSTDQYESTPTFTPDGREMYFMRANARFENYHLLWSRCQNGAWTKPAAPAFAAARPVLEADPHVTHDGKRLYFVSARDSANAENLDIWYVERTARGEWGGARRLPEPVNSPGSELLPRTDAAGALYFGSDRRGGLGQGDIYKATANEDGSWRVANVGAPVNTPAFEYEAEISRDGRTMIVVADRGDRSHLYQFTREQDGWVEQGRIPAYAQAFQVGPLLSPAGDRLLFAQAMDKRSGEIFLHDLKPNTDASWPPACR